MLVCLVILFILSHVCLSVPMSVCVGSVQAHPFFDGLDWKAVYEKKVAPRYIPRVRGNADISNFDQVFTRVRILPPFVSGRAMLLASDYSTFFFVFSSFCLPFPFSAAMLLHLAAPALKACRFRPGSGSVFADGVIELVRFCMVC